MMLLKHQLRILRKVAAADDGSPMRRDTFADSSLIPQIRRYVRRVGRPRQDWTNELLKVGAARFGTNKVEMMLADRTAGAEERWKQELVRLFPRVENLNM